MMKDLLAIISFVASASLVAACGRGENKDAACNRTSWDFEDGTAQGLEAFGEVVDGKGRMGGRALELGPRPNTDEMDRPFSTAFTECGADGVIARRVLSGWFFLEGPSVDPLSTCTIEGWQQEQPSGTPVEYAFANAPPVGEWFEISVELTKPVAAMSGACTVFLAEFAPWNGRFFVDDIRLE